MEYRVNQRTGDKISVLGFGTSYIAEASEKDAVATILREPMAGVQMAKPSGEVLSGSLRSLKQIILTMDSSTVLMNCLTGRNTSETALLLI